MRAMRIRPTSHQAEAIGYATMARSEAEMARYQLDQLTAASFDNDEDRVALDLLDGATIYLERAYVLARRARAAVADCQHIIWSSTRTDDCPLSCAYCGLYVRDEDAEEVRQHDHKNAIRPLGTETAQGCEDDV